MKALCFEQVNFDLSQGQVVLVFADIASNDVNFCAEIWFGSRYVFKDVSDEVEFCERSWFHDHANFTKGAELGVEKAEILDESVAAIIFDLANDFGSADGC